MNRTCRHLELSFVFGCDPILTHQTGDTMFATEITVFIQFFMDSRTSIVFTTLLMNHFNLHQQPTVLLLTRVLRVIQLGIEPTSTNSLSLTLQTHWVCFSMVSYENIFHRGSSEKMATAFFNMSRFIRRRSFSRFNWRNASSSGLKRPLPGKGSSFPSSYFIFQRRSKPSPIPS